MDEKSSASPSPPPVTNLRRRQRLSGILTSLLLGTVSLLVALFAWQASVYSNEASRLDSIASRMSVDSIRKGQRDYADHLGDLQIWLAIEASGVPLDESPLAHRLSQSWREALSRTDAAAATEGLPVDAIYWNELSVEAEARKLAIAGAYDDARWAAEASSRLTGATVIYSAALLLLTVASSSASTPRLRFALAGAATFIILVAFVFGTAPLRLP